MTTFTSLDLMPKPFDWIAIPDKGYDIAKYPITNEQFSVFIEDGGYKNDEWWTELGLEYRNKEYLSEPHFWQDSKWNGNKQPQFHGREHHCAATAFLLILAQAAEAMLGRRRATRPPAGVLHSCQSN